MDVCLTDNTKTTSKITNKCNYEIILSMQIETRIKKE